MSSGALGALDTALAAEQSSLPPVPREGLSLAALRAFADKHVGTTYSVLRADADCADAVAFELLTTAEVCATLIKPATLDSGAGGTQCTYAELLLAQVRARLLRPFVSAER